MQCNRRREVDYWLFRTLSNKLIKTEINVIDRFVILNLLFQIQVTHSIEISTSNSAKFQPHRRPHTLFLHGFWLFFFSLCISHHHNFSIIIYQLINISFSLIFVFLVCFLFCLWHVRCLIQRMNDRFAVGQLTHFHRTVSTARKQTSMRINIQLGDALCLENTTAWMFARKCVQRGVHGETPNLK
jgi:hypothetical protein